ncbi:selenium cofactor biosynthesis protein YqeC [Desulforhopalus sp. 52FAK]
MYSQNSSFIHAFGLGKGGVACIVGAGGKTSLMWRLAAEAKSLGLRTLVSTTTKMFIPEPVQYDHIDLSGSGYTEIILVPPGVYVAGRQVSPVKMQGLAGDVLLKSADHFDLVLLEADGAARKPLKGWLETEPVIPPYTTHTIGVVDIQIIGRAASEDLVHRLDCFCLLTGATVGDEIALDHLSRIITGEKGLFFHSLGQRIVYINKVESDDNIENAKLLQTFVPGYTVCAGSVKMKRIYFSK